MIATASTLLTISWTLCLTVSVLRTLKNGPDRALALPTPFMLLLVCKTQLATADPWYVFLAAHVSVMVLLYGCYQQKRNVARWAAVACGGAVFWMQVSAAFLTDV
jgi:hypothetical protein